MRFSALTAPGELAVPGLRRHAFSLQIDGSSTVVLGAHFMGVQYQRKWKSATFLGVAEDAPFWSEGCRSQIAALCFSSAARPALRAR
jgi:hypothetical protein